MPRIVHLIVIGQPAPQGSKTRMPNGAMVEGKTAAQRANLAAWRKAIADACRAWLADHPRPPLDEPVRVEIQFRFAAPRSDPYRTFHAVKPDVDKCARAVLDALVHGGMLGDDARVCDLVTRKRYASGLEPVGASIEITPLGEIEFHKRDLLKQAARLQRVGMERPAG